MQLRVKPSAWITTSGLSPTSTRSTARIRISSRVLWSRARASRRFMSHCTICLLTYELVNTLLRSELTDINSTVVELEAMLSPTFRKTVQAQVTEKKRELDA